MPGAPTRQSGARHVVMRELNRSLVLDLIKKHSPVSRAGIAQAASLAKPTVSIIVDELLERGLVREIGVGSTTREGGRPPILLEYDAMSQCLAGVHIGVRTTTVVLADGTGSEFHRVSSATPEGPARATLAKVVKLLRRAIEDAAAPARGLAVGVCLPGLVDVRTGECRLAPNLGWRDVPVRTVLEKALDAPVYVHNTAQACAVAEAVEGAARGAEHVALLYLGSGVGSGLLSGGRVFTGASGMTGEVGHSPVAGHDDPCSCGRRGCLESVASGRAIARDADRAVAARRRTSLARLGRPLTVEDISAAAAAGDRVAAELLGAAGAHLGRAAAWLINLANPEVLVLSGGLVQVGAPLLDPLRTTLDAHVLPQLAVSLRIEVSELGPQAEVRGAVLLAMQYAETYYRVVFQGA